MEKEKKVASLGSDFDFAAFEKEAVKQLKSGKPLSGKEGVLTPLIKRILENALQGELEAHLEEEPAESKNRRNGKTSKTMKSEHGAFELEAQRDRNSTFEPEIIKKRQTTLAPALEGKILSLYGLGMSYSDISGHIEEMYGIEVSPATISSVTDKIIPVIEEWRSRPLDAIYPMVRMDAMHYKVKEEGRIVPKAVYGFPEAITTIFPATDVQLCVVHQIRNSLRYVASKDQKAFLRDLKEVYRAATKALAEQRLKELGEAWGKKYPVVIKSWNTNWERLSQYFKYPEDIRRIIYTTNVVEGFHRQIRKVTKTKGAFTSDTALIKLIYMATQNISKKWTQPMRNAHSAGDTVG